MERRLIFIVPAAPGVPAPSCPKYQNNILASIITRGKVKMSYQTMKNMDQRVSSQNKMKTWPVHCGAKIKRTDSGGGSFILPLQAMLTYRILH